MQEKITQLEKEKQELEQKLADPETLQHAEHIKEYSVAFAKVEKELTDLYKLKELETRIAEAKGILTDKEHELASIAEEELKTLEAEHAALAHKLSGAEADIPDDLIIEIRAGAGGDEASLFARELYTMYTRFATNHNWNVTLLDESQNDIGGIKEVIVSIKGEDAYRTLQYESGVHRVQRIPATEKSGRVHTSTVSVAVLPQAREVDIEINPQDVETSFFRSSGPGGQNVNKVETAVRLHHIPSGLVITSQDSRSQQTNREHAYIILRARLFDEQRRKQEEKAASERKQQIGTGDRSEKIRTYNFPQDRITDHRIKKSWHGIEDILAGALEPIITTLAQTKNTPA